MGHYNVNNQIAELKAWVGFREGNGNIQPFTAWQFNGGLHDLAWCASFADYCAVQFGGFEWPGYCQCGYKGDAYVPNIITHAQNMGIWRGPSEIAHPGWQAIYTWDGHTPDHIETVIWDNGNGTTTNIGGNTGDMVAWRVRGKAGNNPLMGFAALDLAAQNASGVTAPTGPPANTSTGGSNVIKEDIVDAVATATLKGSWRLQADGGVFAEGDAKFCGSIPGTKGGSGGNIVLQMGVNHALSMLPTPTGHGYWILCLDGGIFSYGDAEYKGNFQYLKGFGTHGTKLVSDGKGLYETIAASTGAIAPRR